MPGLQVRVRSRRLLWTTLLLISSPLWTQEVSGPPSLQQLEPAANEPIQDDPMGRARWMRERFSGDPLDYKDMMLRETERQRTLYPNLEAGAPQTGIQQTSV